MTTYTLCVDESGVFGTGSVSEKRGFRCVAGVLLPDHNAARLMERLERAFDGWRGRWRAADVKRSRSLSADRKYEIRARVLEIVGATSAQLVLAMEDDTAGSGDRWVPMLNALVSHTALRIAHSAQQPCTLNVAVEQFGPYSSAQLPSLDIARRSSVIAARRSWQPVELKGPEMKTKQDRFPGVVLADFVANEVGPKRNTQMEDFGKSGRASRNLGSVRDRLRGLCGSDVPVSVCGSYAAFPAALDALSGAINPVEARQRISSLLVNLPGGTPRIAAQSALEVLSEWGLE